MSRYRHILLYVFIIFCWLKPAGSSIYGQDSLKTVKQDSATADSKKKDKKQEGKAIEVKLSFKKLFHKNDSTKLAKRYIRWHNKLIKTGKSHTLKIDNKDLKDSIPPMDSIEMTKEVLGWYPYWEDPDLYKYLDYSLINTIAYFSYKVNPKNGEPDTIYNWKTTSMIDKAKSKKVKVLLTITNFGISNNRKFLSNPTAGATLITRIIELLDLRSADGVCIDFEGIHKSQRNNYNSFIVAISERLKKHNNNYLVYLAVPAVNWNSILDFDTLIGKVDQFVIMGYDYYGASSKIAGPVAPLKSGKIWNPFNLTNSVDYYLSKGIPSSEIILALPFYGNIWDTKTGQRGSKSNRFDTGITFDAIKSFLHNNAELKPRTDAISASSWLSYFGNNSTTKNKRQFKQLWYDSEQNMEDKFNLINNRGLNGIGIWALGYNKKYRNYWNLVEKSFSIPKSSPPMPPSDIKYPDSIRIIITGDKKVEDGSEKVIVTDKDSIYAELGEINKNVKELSENVSDLSNIEKSKINKKSLLAKLRSNLAEFSAIADKFGNSKNSLLLILSFIALFGGIGLAISMFMPNTRMFFFSSNAMTVYYMLIILFFVLAFLWKKEYIDSISTAFILAFVLGGTAYYLINSNILKHSKNLP